MHIATGERRQAQLVDCAGRPARGDRGGLSGARIARRAAWSTALAAVAAATLVGCTRHSSGATPTPTLSAPTSDLSGAGDAAASAYRGMWQAYANAGRTSNPNDPGLSQYAIGNALKALQVGLETNKKQGLISTGQPVTRPQVSSVTPASQPDSVEISDCLDTTSFQRERADGKPFTDTPGGRRAVKATVKRFKDQWKVTDFVPGGVGSC